MTSTALITGADRGLGLALCSGLLEQGWRVFAGQFMPEWSELSDLVDRYPETLHIVPLDVRSIDSARDAAKDGAGSEFGVPGDSAPAAAEQADSVLLNAPGVSGAPGDMLESAVEGESLPPLEIVPYEVAPQGDDAVGAAATSLPQAVPAESGAQPVTAHDVMTTDWEEGERSAVPASPVE